MPEPGGSWAIGLATFATGNGARDDARSYPDVSFLRLWPGRQLVDLGLVSGAGPDGQPFVPDRSYVCEVSCYDWYGTTRAVFLAGRRFALMGTVLVEADLSGPTVREVDRLGLTGPVAPRP